MPPRIEIEAQVLEYIPDAMTDIFKGNRFAAFDAAALMILAPTEMADRRLIIYLPQPTVTPSPWRQAGLRVSFDIAAEMLAPETTIFLSAVHDLHVRQAPEARIREDGND